jgi:endonuclease G
MKSNVDSRLNVIKFGDPDLYSELESLRQNRYIQDQAAELEISLNKGNDEVQEIVGPLSNNSDLALETIVLKVGRPVLTISNDEAQLDFRDAESEVWRQRLISAKSDLVHAAKAVGRIELKNDPTYDWVGTGWLVGKDIVVTNRHVAQVFTQRRGHDLIFRQNLNGLQLQANIDFLEEAGNNLECVFRIIEIIAVDDDGPDMAFFRVEQSGQTILAEPILLDTAVATKSQLVAVIGYPAHDSRIPDFDLMTRIFGNVYNKKRLAPGTITGASGNQITHDCSTLGGNSGSVVLDLVTGKAVGLHFAGRYLENNFAVPAALINSKLEHIEKHTLHNSTKQANTHNRPETLVVQLQTGNNETAAMSIPLNLEVSVKITHRLDQVVNVLQTSIADVVITEGSVADYSDRIGYDESFLLTAKVPLPKVTDVDLKKDILVYEINGEQKSVLPYRHFSVLMSKGRRQCVYSAVNIDGKTSVPMARGGWRLDPRILVSDQIMKECYGNAPKFSRGHMTRREDPIWGTDDEAMQGNVDSMHVTNTVPQMQSMNAGIWLGLENYALQHARKDKMRICVFTGPVFKPNDPIKYGIIIPLAFWKVIAFIHDETEKLCATGYRLSQKDFLSESEFVFGAHDAAQVSIASIQRETGLSFGKLSDLDPYGKNNELLFYPVKPDDHLRRYSEIKFF